MTHSSFTPTESTLPRLFNEMAAVCAGLAVPFIAFGPGGMGVAMAMCILAMALSSDRSLFFSYTWHQAFTGLIHQQELRLKAQSSGSCDHLLFAAA